jgi:putative NADH-flavin reductase
MRVLVVGGTRGCGREVVLQGSARGHEMTLLARRIEQAPVAPRLTLVAGDACDTASMAAAVTEQDAVIVCLGVDPTRAPVSLFSASMRVLLDALRHANTRRVLYVTGIGAGESRGHGGFWYDRIVQPLRLATIYADKDRSEAMLRATDLSWTICRPGFLTNGPMLARYRIVTRLDAVPQLRARSISRADVAHFLLEEVERNEFVGAAPLVCY